MLIEKGARVNVSDENGQTSLHWAAGHGDLATAKTLVNAGAVVDVKDADGHLPVDLAHTSGKGELVAYLKTVGPSWSFQRLSKKSK